jgi:hypothetical protein
MDTLTVRVTAQDIMTSIRRVREGWNGTPLTLAIRRAFDCKYLDPFVTIWHRKAELWIHAGLYYTAGREATFINRWEAGETVAPMSFRLQVETERWGRWRNRIIKYHERSCWGCSRYVPRETCRCTPSLFSPRDCSLCMAVFCKTCLPAMKPYASCRNSPDRHLSLKVGEFDPVFSHRCPSVQTKLSLIGKESA